MHQEATEPAARATGSMDRTVPWWVIGVLVLAFGVLSALTAGDNTLTLDLNVTEQIQSLEGRTARFLGWLGDHLGGTRTGLTCLAVGFVAAAFLRSLRDAVFLGIAALLRLLATYLKGIFDSPRPTIEQVDLSRVYESTGFPSGHVTTSALILATIVFMTMPLVNSRIVYVLGGIWLAGVAATAFARMWHGAHWFTDTVGGAIVGLVIVLVAANVSATVMQWRASDRRR